MLDLNSSALSQMIRSDRLIVTAISVTGSGHATQLSKGILLRETDVTARVPFGVLASFSQGLTEISIGVAKYVTAFLQEHLLKKLLPFPRKPEPPEHNDLPWVVQEQLLTPSLFFDFCLLLKEVKGYFCYW